MPIPKPNENESQDEFMQRCMVDETMVSEYPDENQRYAICLQQSRKDGGKSMDKIKKVFNCEVKQIGEESERILRFVGSDETPDRDDDIIEAAGWKLEEYQKNPVFLWAHNYEMPPIGKAVKVEKDLAKKCLVFDVKFPTVEELSSDVRNPSEHAKFIDTIYNLYRGNYLSATSVGFRGIKFKPRDDDEMNNKPEWQRGRRYLEQSLLELSAVPVPSNPNALQQAKSAGVAGVEAVEKALAEVKRVVPYKSFPTEPESTEWDGPAEIAAAEVDDLKIMAAWYDAENADVKQSYKLPHHRASDKHLIWRAVTAAMGALLGARGGVDIPEDDRKGVYNHLAKHYKNDFDKEPPEFRAYDDAELKEMFPEDIPLKEVDLLVDTTSKEVFVLEDGTKTAKVKIAPEYYQQIFEKAGATLSAKNRDLLNSIHAAMEGNLKKLKEFLDSVMPMAPDDEPMITAERTAPINVMTAKIEMSEEFKQALEDLKAQVLLLSQKMTAEPEKPDANKVEIDLDAIELPKIAKDPAEIELNIEPGELKNMIAETVKNLIQGGTLA